MTNSTLISRLMGPVLLFMGYQGSKSEVPGR
jgi:hypothetical protein